MNNKVIIFSAPSGAGKSTIVNHLLAKYPELEFSISATSRAPRGQEKHGIEYYFFSSDEFRKLIAEDSFVEYEEVYAGSFYGTLKSEVDRIWAKGHTIIFSTHNMNSVEEICDDFALINRSHLVLEGCVDDVRRQFKSNLFYVEADSQKILPPVDGVEILSIEAAGDTTRYKLKKHQEMTNSELVSALAQKIEISTFKEFIPSMNEIFIKVVGEQNIQQPLKSSNYEQ